MTSTAPHAEDATLEKVDILRKRFPISYREAYEMLEENQGNLVKALIELEDKKKCGPRPFASNPLASNLKSSVLDAGESLMENGRSMVDKMEERITVMGSELATKIQEIVRTGQTSQIRVMRDGRTVLTIPTAVGAIGALFFPYAAVIATVAAMTARYELVLDKRQPSARADRSMCHTNATPAVTNVHDENKTCPTEMNQAMNQATGDHFDADGR